MRKVLVVLCLAACSGDKVPPPETGTDSIGGLPDRDGDGFAPPGDCDDQDPAIYPGADDPPYDGLDGDCMGDNDFDADGDGSLWVEAEGGDDCDDANPEVHPGADEVCNALDDDCDGVIDGEGAQGAQAWYPDQDGDGMGEDAEVIYACEQPPDTVDIAGDCDDSDATAYPGAPAIPCDGVDNDCDPSTIETGGALVGGNVVLDLHAVVEAATEGEVISLCEGRIAVNALLLDRGLTLAGQGSALTVLDGGGAGSVLEVETTSPVTLSGFTVTGGIGKGVDAERQGGGLWMGPGADVTGTDLRFEENRAGRGGAIWLGADASLRLSSSALYSNHGDPGSAVVPSGGALASESGGQLLFDAVTVEANDAMRCGGLELNGTLLEGSGTTEIVENETLGLEGGGLCAEGSTLRDLLLARNLSPNAAGGLAGTDVTLEGLEILENESGLSGGGAWLSGTIELVGCTFSGNLAGIDGGGFALTGSASTARIADSAVTNNTASFVGALGGGAQLDQASLVSENTDWGTAATDNSPSDVYLLQNNEGYGYGGPASFTCNDVPGQGTCE